MQVGVRLVGCGRLNRGWRFEGAGCRAHCLIHELNGGVLPESSPLLPHHAFSHAGLGAQPLECHLATDANGDLLLCLLSHGTQRLTALRLPPAAAAAAAPLAAGKRVEVAFSLPAVAVAAVTATLHSNARQAGSDSSGRSVPPRDLLVLQPDGRLGLYAGRHRLCTVALPSDSGPPSAYAQLVRLPRQGGGGDGREHLGTNHSELSGSKRPPSTGGPPPGRQGGCRRPITWILTASAQQCMVESSLTLAALAPPPDPCTTRTLHMSPPPLCSRGAIGGGRRRRRLRRR